MSDPAGLAGSPTAGQQWFVAELFHCATLALSFAIAFPLLVSAPLAFCCFSRNAPQSAARNHDEVGRLLVKTAKSSNFCQGVFLLFFSLLLALIPQLPFFHKMVISSSTKESAKLAISLFFYALSVVMLLLSCSCLRTYVLTEKGILHYLFGIRYRVTPWPDIQDILRVYLNPKKGIELLVIRQGTQILRPRTRGWNKGLIVGNFRTQIFPTLTGKLFTLRDTPEILDCIRLYYGELNFDDKK